MIFCAQASAPITSTSILPVPATTAVPDIMASARFLRTERDSPVRADSSISRPLTSRAWPSAGIWSPNFKRMTSWVTRWALSTSTHVPSRRASEVGAWRTASESSAFLERSSEKTPIARLKTRTKPKTASRQSPSANTAATQTNSIPLKMVKRLERRIALTGREVESSTSFDSPRARRRSTSSCVSPS